METRYKFRGMYEVVTSSESNKVINVMKQIYVSTKKINATRIFKHRSQNNYVQNKRCRTLKSTVEGTCIRWMISNLLKHDT